MEKFEIPQVDFRTPDLKVHITFSLLSHRQIIFKCLTFLSPNCPNECLRNWNKCRIIKFSFDWSFSCVQLAPQQPGPGHVSSRKVSASSRGLGSGTSGLGQDNPAFLADVDPLSIKSWLKICSLKWKISDRFQSLRNNDQSDDKALSKLEIEGKNEEKRKK